MRALVISNLLFLKAFLDNQIVPVNHFLSFQVRFPLTCSLIFGGCFGSFLCSICYVYYPTDEMLIQTFS